jgi:hypothetical protein
MSATQSGFRQVLTSGYIEPLTEYWFVVETGFGTQQYRTLNAGYSLGGLTSSTATPFGYRTFGGSSVGATYSRSQLIYSTIPPILVGFII